VLCLWESLVWAWGSENVLCVGEIHVDLGECDCVVFGKDCWGFVG